MKIDRLDHLVLTVADIGVACDFYARLPGMDVITFGEGGTALAFGEEKINLHWMGGEREPKAERPAPGSADLRFITSLSLEGVIPHLHLCGVPILEGPVSRTGTPGPIVSVYFRDPDMNLIEVARYVDGE